MWWEKFPLYAAIDDRERLKKLNIRINHAYTGDPGWGPMAQILHAIDAEKIIRAHKEDGIHPIAWMETYGTCFIYAVAYKKNADGSFIWQYLTEEQKRRFFGEEAVGEELFYAKSSYNAWNWDASVLKEAPDAVRWMGPHNTVNQEDIIGNTFTPERLGLPLPAYPDGTPAVGWTKNETYPLNAKFYDAVCSKDIFGVIDKYGESVARPAPCNTIDEKTGQPSASVLGLYSLTVTENDRLYLPYQVGEHIYIAIMGVGKDPAAPFWGDYMYQSARNHVRAGVDGLWCDNVSPFNNFGFIPMQNGFGEWSVARFRDYLRTHFTAEQLDALGIADPASFDVRSYLIEKARDFGARDAGSYLDRVWRDPRWLEDDIWQAYKIHKSEMGHEGISRFYHSIKKAAADEGRPDFCIMGNDIPWSMGWVTDDVLDMVSTEVGPGWCYLAGEHGFGQPPYGKLAPHYRAAYEHQSGPYMTFWYYLSHVKGGGNPNQIRVLLAEGLANHAFLKYGSGCVDNDEAAVPWNDFLVKQEPEYLGRKPVADVGIWFSGANQLEQVPPGHFTMTPDAQPHTFEYNGFANAMIDANMPFRAVTDWKLTDAVLGGLSAFVVPNAECIDDDALPVLRRFAEAGGRLVITGGSGMRYGTKGIFRRRSHSLLDELLDGSATILPYTSEASRSGVKIFVEGAEDIRQLTDAEEAAEETSAVRHEIRIECPLGKGSVCYLSAPVGMNYFLNDAKREELLPVLVGAVGGYRTLTPVRMPFTTATSVWYNPEESSLHCDILNYALDVDSDTITPTGELVFRVSLPEGKTLKNCKLLTPEPGVAVSAEPADGGVLVRVSSVEVFATVKLLLA